ncbi:MAG: PTS sugar transporter subunit IIC [Bacilli bacterium]
MSNKDLNKFFKRKTSNIQDDKKNKSKDYKTKMQSVINAQKMLDSDVIEENPLKSKMREHLAATSSQESKENKINKAALQSEEEKAELTANLKEHSGRKINHLGDSDKTQTPSEKEKNSDDELKNPKINNDAKSKNVSLTNGPKENEIKIGHPKLKSFWKAVIKTMNGMAYGLFATLIIGTIIATIGGFFPVDSTAYKTLTALATALKYMTGLGIGLGVAWSMGYKDLKLLSVSVTGGIVSYLSGSAYGFKVGDPLTIYLIVVISAKLMDLVFTKKTPVDIIIIPLFTSLISGALTILLSQYLAFITTGIGTYIGVATQYQPFLMGIVIAVIMGMALTAPISSAAIAATVFTQDAYLANPYVAIAGGAALIGCCCQMVGFSIQARRDNGIGTVFAIMFGTSMLQFKNILKKPIIWLPTIIASAILGPIATCVLHIKCIGAAAGMGTSGLVGQIGTINLMGHDWNVWLIVLFEILAPLILVYLIDLIFWKTKLIKADYLKV